MTHPVTILAEQLSVEDDLIRQRDSARDWAVHYEQQAAALTERLTQLQGSAYHVEGDGQFHALCLLCGDDWPCPGYGREVGEWLLTP